MATHLVTGAAGFIGHRLCEQLLASGHRVVGVDNLNAYYDPQLKRDRLATLQQHVSFEFIKVELSDAEEVAKLFNANQYESVFHMAAQPGVRYSLEDPQAYVSSNLVAFSHILEGCRHHGAPHLIYASSSSVYGGNTKVPFSVDDPVDHPMSLYAATKRSNELTATAYAQLYDLPITGLRFFTVYGPWGRPDMAIYKFAEAMQAGRPIQVYNFGRMRRDFTYIDDIVDGILQAAEAFYNRPEETRNKHRLYNLGNNTSVELGHLIATLEHELGVVAEKQMLPMQPGDVPLTYADIEKSRNELGFQPKTSIEEGVQRFVAWKRSYEARRKVAAI